MLLLLHGVLAGHAFTRHNPTIDEPDHLLSGLFVWKQGYLAYYYVNPPLVKLAQTAPLLAVDWELPPLPAPRNWRGMQDAFVAANHSRLFSWVFAARSVNLLLSLACGWLMYRWARELFGAAAGLAALGLWAFCPFILAWVGICTADVGAAFFALAAVAGLRTYLHRPAALTAGWAGLLLGLAQLAKFSLLILYPVTVALWLAAAWPPDRANGASPRPRWFHLVLLLLVSLVVVNLGYGFQGTGKPLGSFRFLCHALSDGDGDWGNRFSGTWLESVPVPLPDAYLRGLDEQKSHSDRGLFEAYLRGEWRNGGGWWYYYLYAFAVKLPLGTLLLAGLAAALAVASRRYRAAALEEALLWLPAAALLGLLSFETGMNSHSRYALPLFPFAFIGISRVGLLFAAARQAGGAAVGGNPWAARLGGAVVLGALAWNAAAALRVHPHYLSYFNELAGGPDNGWRHLIESNIDWGQDLLFLKRWVEEHPEARPLYLAYYGAVDPHLVGLDYRLAPLGWENGTNGDRLEPPPDELELRPGWYAVSVDLVCGMGGLVHNEQGQKIYVWSGVYTYFQYFRPTAKAGYSIFIYHITPEQAAEVRKQLE